MSMRGLLKNFLFFGFMSFIFFLLYSYFDHGTVILDFKCIWKAMGSATVPTIIGIILDYKLKKKGFNNH